MFDDDAFQSACSQVDTAMAFGPTRQHVEELISEMEQSPILPFQKAQYRRLGHEALERLEARRTDPVSMLGAIRYQVSNFDPASMVELDEWFRSACREWPERLDASIMAAMRQLRGCDPSFDAEVWIKEISTSAKRVSVYARTGVELERTRQEIVQKRMVLASLPLDGTVVKDIETLLNEAEISLEARLGTPLVELLTDALASYEEIVAPGSPLDQDTSRMLHGNIQGIKRVLANSELEEADRELIEQRLNKLDSTFDSLRFLSSTTVFLRYFQPRLQALRMDVEAAIDFDQAIAALNEVRLDARNAAKVPTDSGRLGSFHLKAVLADADDVFGILDRRRKNPFALLSELTRAVGVLADLETRAVVGRSQVMRLQRDISATRSWAKRFSSTDTGAYGRFANVISSLAIHLSDDTLRLIRDGDSAMQALQNPADADDSSVSIALSTLRSLREAGNSVSEVDRNAIETSVAALCGPYALLITANLKNRANRVWQSIDARYAEYVQSLHAEINLMSAMVKEAEDFWALWSDIDELANSFDATNEDLHNTDLNQLRNRMVGVRNIATSRMFDAADIENQLGAADATLNSVGGNFHRSREIQDAETRIERQLFRLRRARQMPKRDALLRECDRLRARIRGLARARAAFLERRESNRNAMFEDLAEQVQEGARRAREQARNASTMQFLRDLEAEIENASILSRQQTNELFEQLDAATRTLHEERKAFARRAAEVFTQYLDPIQNLLADLERFSPPPTRQDAFSAIEMVKPLRSGLRQEDRLLKVHKDELFDRLRTVSDAISEILDSATAEMSRNHSQLRDEIESLERLAAEAPRSGDLRAIMAQHKSLYGKIFSTELSIEARRDCRATMENVWTLIVERQREVGRERFDPANIDATLVRLERLGQFLWREGAPTLT